MEWVHHTRVEPEQRGGLPVQVEQSVELDCTPDALFDVFEDASAWAGFMDLEVHWHGDPPYEAGSSRTITAGSLHALERFTVYERGQRMSFFFEKSSASLFDAFAEDWIVEPIGERRCRLTWRVGIAPKGWLRWVGFGFRFVMRRMGQRSFPRLADHVRARAG